MNRIISWATALVALTLPAAVFAATITFSPASVPVTTGQTFTVTVTANPGSTKVYTMRANISFNPALLEVTDFTFAPKWLPLAQTAEYDNTDNVNGSLVKTAGYPGGITAPTVLGTITFKAKASGVANVTVGTNSLALDAKNNNAITGTQGSAQVTVSAPAPAPKTKTTTVTQPSTQTAAPAQTQPATTTVATTTATTTPVAVVATATPVAVAAAASSGSGFFGSIWTWIVLAILLIGIGAWIYSGRKKSL